jgi:limonene 1,2-monooxygenase
VATQIERLLEQSKGGFGAFLLLAHEWANSQATRRSYELIAQEVLPRFQGQAQTTLDAARRAEAARPELAQDAMKAVEAMTAKHQAELAERALSVRSHTGR